MVFTLNKAEEGVKVNFTNSRHRSKQKHKDRITDLHHVYIIRCKAVLIKADLGLDYFPHATRCRCSGTMLCNTQRIPATF